MGMMRKRGVDNASDLGINRNSNGTYIPKHLHVHVMDGHGFDRLYSFATREEQLAFIANKEGKCSFYGNTINLKIEPIQEFYEM